MKHIFNDVVVVGSGCAGLIAAINAARLGAKVLVLSKAVPGGANNTAVSGGGFCTSSPGVTPEEHYQLTLAAGAYLNNEEQVRLLVENAERAVLGLREFGVELISRVQGYATPGKIHVEGVNITRPLMTYARKLGINFKGQFMAGDILIDEKAEAVGLWGYDYQAGEFVAVGARALVLAVGGGGNLFARSNNPYPMTGDGFALINRAGLPLIDMEFVQFYPLSVAKPGAAASFIHPAALEVGRLLNAGDENITAKYNITARPLAIKARDRLSQAIVRENLLSGGQSDVVLDLRGYSEEDWQERGKAFPESQLQQLRTVMVKKYNAVEKPIPVLPTCHFLMGGVTVNNHTETSVAGLFAAGEIVGGLHGANRLGGNALTEAVVFGEIAGRNAAKLAVSSRTVIDPVEMTRRVTVKIDEMKQLFKMGASCGEIKQEVQSIMWEKVGVIRSGAQLSAAVAGLAKLESELAILDWIDPAKVLLGLETRNQVLVGKLIAESALERTESRGAHFRNDFPHQDDNWHRHITINNT